MKPEQIAGDSEHSQQAAFFCWAQQSNIPELKWLFAIPNGFFGSAAQKNKMKSEGLKSGIADIFLPISNSYPDYNGDYGLFIEMKVESMRNRKNGGLSDEQKEFSEFVTRQGYQFEVCYSWIETRDAVLKYLGRS